MYDGRFYEEENEGLRAWKKVRFFQENPDPAYTEENKEDDLETFYSAFVRRYESDKPGLMIGKKYTDDEAEKNEIKEDSKYYAYALQLMTAYEKIYCQKFSTTKHQYKKCKKMHNAIKNLIRKNEHRGIHIFHEDNPRKNLLHIPHYPRKTSIKARSVETSKKSKKSKKLKTTKSLGGKRTTLHRRTCKMGKTAIGLTLSLNK